MAGQAEFQLLVEADSKLGNRTKARRSRRAFVTWLQTYTSNLLLIVVTLNMEAGDGREICGAAY